MKRNSTFQPTQWLLLFFWLCSAVVMAQNISGKVTDENGQALPGVSITEKGTNKGTVSQIDGTYKLVVNATSTLVFSFVGYTTEEVIVGSQTKININLQPDNNALNEVVVVGYGTQKKKDLSDRGHERRNRQVES